MKQAIQAFVERLTVEANAELVERYGNSNPESTYDPRKSFTVKYGRKYARINSYDANGSGGGTWGFVEIESGDIYKAASYKAPAKHARGNIATAVFGRHYFWTGPRYLK